MGRQLGVVTAILALVLVAIAAEATLLQPTVVGWERYFQVDLQSDTRAGRPFVSGYIKNEFGLPATRVRLLVEGVGPGGAPTSQQVAWLGQILMPGARVYFEVPPAQPAASYRVSVFAFDWVDPMGS